LLQLVHLYAERGSPKYERAALRWLQRYLNESTPRLQHFAESPRTLQHLKGGGSLDALSGASLHLLRLADGADVVVSRGQTSGFTDSGLVIADGSRLRLVRFDQLPRL
jgi:hypothetical protein